jgi:hypothetical protein
MYDTAAKRPQRLRNAPSANGAVSRRAEVRPTEAAPQGLVARTGSHPQRNPHVAQLKALQRLLNHGERAQRFRDLLRPRPTSCSTSSSSPSDVVAQRIGPEYEGLSPEKSDLKSLQTRWDFLGEHVDDPKDRLSNRLYLLESHVPWLATHAVSQILQQLDDQPFSVVWKALLLGKTRPKPDAEEGEKDQIERPLPGRHHRWTLIDRKLGAGTEADVFWGFPRGGGPAAAIKIFKGDDERYDEAFRKEVSAFQVLQGFEREGRPIPHLVRMLDYNSYVRAVVMEQVRGYPVDHLKATAATPDGKPFPGVPRLTADAIERMEAAQGAAYVETRAELAARGYRLGDVQDRNTMYEPATNQVTFVDISLERL